MAQMWGKFSHLISGTNKFTKENSTQVVVSICVIFLAFDTIQLKPYELMLRKSVLSKEEKLAPYQEKQPSKEPPKHIF